MPFIRRYDIGKFPMASAAAATIQAPDYEYHLIAVRKDYCARDLTPNSQLTAANRAHARLIGYDERFCPPGLPSFYIQLCLPFHVTALIVAFLRIMSNSNERVHALVKDGALTPR